MTAYARSDVYGVTVPTEVGGCGAPHVRQLLNPESVNEGGEPEYAREFAVECPSCGPILIERNGFTSSPTNVELTPDELERQKRLEKEGSAATQIMAGELGKKLAALVLNAQAANDAPAA